ncbi:hypothetical protein F4779DRAFT_252542 [Xylariaceae sp. FL0662B]|nr:hypothetical protein F4779DRAFT_252542 [Xylariaceae sp. FL0662B]
MLFMKKSPSFFFKGREDSNKEIPSGANQKSSTDGSVSGESLLSENEIRNIRSRRPFRRGLWWLGFALVHLILLIIYAGTVASLRTEVGRLRKYGPRLVNTPANEAIEWEEHIFDENNMPNAPFSGPPRDEIDQNWHNLLNVENIILEPELMKAYGRDQFGVAVPDGKGFLGTLNVYHELHCIKRIYQYTYPEIYTPDETPEQRKMNTMHKDHCLDFLRQSSMCHADVGVITFQWDSSSLVPVANSTSHQCANWKKLEEWSKARTVNMMKPGWLIHPEKGPAYPDGDDW